MVGVIQRDVNVVQQLSQMVFLHVTGLFYMQELLAAGYGTFRVELVDESSEVVAPLLQGYYDVMRGKRQVSDLWGWLKALQDANGRAHGVSAGSLEAHVERSSASLRPTARR